MTKRFSSRRGSKWRMRRRAYLLILYGFLGIMIVYNIIPFYWMVATSFKSAAESYRIPPTLWPEEPTFYAYKRVLIWTPFPRYFANSIVVSGCTSLFSTLIGTLAGYACSRFYIRGKRWFLGAVLATQMLPGVLLVGPYFRVLSKIGLYDTLAGLILAFTSITLPFSIWMMKGFCDTVPRELDEAAFVDGCSYFGVFARVIVPLIGPGMVATVIFAFLLAWGDLLWSACLIASTSKRTVTLVLSQMVTEYRVMWPELMAGSLIAALPPVLLYLILQKYLVRGLTAGAVKG